jgi:hypothetical protein
LKPGDLPIEQPARLELGHAGAGWRGFCLIPLRQPNSDCPLEPFCDKTWKPGEIVLVK